MRVWTEMLECVGAECRFWVSDRGYRLNFEIYGGLITLDYDADRDLMSVAEFGPMTPPGIPPIVGRWIDYQTEAGRDELCNDLMTLNVWYAI